LERKFAAKPPPFHAPELAYLRDSCDYWTLLQTSP